MRYYVKVNHYTSAANFSLKIAIFILFSFFWNVVGSAQNVKHILNFDQHIDTKLGIKDTIVSNDSIFVKGEIKNYINKLRTVGYLQSSLDELEKQSDSLILYKIHVGKKYDKIKLYFSEESKKQLTRNRLIKNYYTPKEVVNIQKEMLTLWENNGYPFARVWLEDFQEDSTGILSAHVLEKTGGFYKIKDINIAGDSKITPTYLYNYLGVKPNQVYSQEKILNIKNRINELSFLEESKDATVNFQSGGETTIKLFLKKKKASRFDFLIGILPNTNPDPLVAIKKKLIITGNITAEFLNTFGAGERFYLEFQQLSPGTQRLNVNARYPYLLQLPFGLTGELQLYKRDTTFLEVNYEFGIQYLLEGGNSVKVFWERKSNTLLSVNAAQIISTKKLPSSSDVDNNFFGLEANYSRLDYKNNPRKGWSTYCRVAAGIKTINKNQQILSLSDPANPDFKFASLYDTLKLRGTAWRMMAHLSYYQGISKLIVMKLSTYQGLVLSDQQLYKNEQFRIGGNKLQRGFDEESVFADAYHLLGLEVRFITGKNSFLYTFFDGGYIHDAVIVGGYQSVYGFGVGTSFETKSGVFGVSYALGVRDNNKLDIKAAKIHFGYISYF
ncbi:MAG: BamA/TamA family outer membrane protein [Saprospiraceae bacterium]|nr:BamA/TamA family outer membrane protein [Saprospiraceae bacterium]